MNKKDLILKKQADISDSTYGILLNDVKSILDKAKYQVYKAVDNLRVQTYWQIGERIVREEIPL